MPDIASRIAAEGHDDPGYRLPVDANRVLPAHFVWVGRCWRIPVSQLASAHILEGVELATIENLKPHHVQVDGVYVVGKVREFPDFSGIQHRSLRDGHVPPRLV